MSKRNIVQIKKINDVLHCGHCCRGVEFCDCELEKVPLYVTYIRNNIEFAKDYAYECVTCGSINKIHQSGL